MTSRPARLLVIAACVLVSAGAAKAQSLSDRGKKKLPKLFSEAVSVASESTVRVECDGKDAALGTIVSPDGYILTKGSELRGAITCTLRDGSSYDAEYIGYNRPSDLALLKIDTGNIKLKPVRFADSKAAEVGNWVAAVGTGSEPIAVGVISVGPRKLAPPPSEEGMITNLNKGALGILMKDPEEGDGVGIRRVEPGTAAAKAGLKVDDVIFEVAGKPVKSRDALIDLLENYKPGDRIIVKVRRGDEEVSLPVKLGSRSDFDRGSFQNAMGGALSGRRTGFPKVIQHDTVIRPTDCGGPLVDLDGRVLGINIARAGRVETWTIPGDVIQPVLKELKEGKSAPISK
jgi:serine protease Do